MKWGREEATLAMSIWMERCSIEDHGHHLAVLRRPGGSLLYAWDMDRSSGKKGRKPPIAALSHARPFTARCLSRCVTTRSSWLGVGSLVGLF